MLENLFAVLGLVAFVAVLAAMAVARSPGGFEAWRVRRRHDRTASTPIAALPENEPGQITGNVAATAPLLTAPLSGRRCVYYAIVVSHHEGRQRHVVVRERRGTSFAVIDRTGRAIIDPSNAQLALCFDASERTGWRDRPTPAQDSILARHGVTSSGWLFPRTLRFEEAVIEVGDVISVIGAGVREPDLASQRESDYRSNAAMQLRMASSAAAPLSLRAELVR